ncbi:protein lin-37 homolog [Trichonephila clavata]|uniref:Protein lin-37 homolog n=1 Tax=Trichonephila clavata TaxID=2740835 RepID=A0A8X6L4E5_TRICU|nr:protein lin-37 homolog [Trichonephila clavata]
MAFRIKQEKVEIAPEIENARAKLEEALQYIIEKTDESPYESEDEYHKGLNDICIKKEPSPISSPAKKPAQRAQRKRRRKDETLNRSANSYIMKLFDRAVDLTPFNDQTPLYPICRAWINNQELYKSAQQIKEEPASGETPAIEEPEKEKEENDDFVRHLPAPSPLEGKDLRIPSPIPQPEEEFVICSDEQNAVSKESLMSKHLQRWKAVRRKWKHAAKLNEDRYRESAAVLKSIFDKAQRRDELTSNHWDTMTSVT